MSRVMIDVPDEDLEVVARVGEKNHRSRKAQLEWIIEDFAMKELGEK